MVLLPDVKKFIELYIDEIESGETRYFLEESMGCMDDAGYRQFKKLLEDIPYEYDLTWVEDEIIEDRCREIRRDNSGDYICIEHEWADYSAHYFGDKDRIIEQFDDLDCDFKDMKHWCFIYEY